ncbi:MAG: permease-like cell division protein FtsX [Candidatus Electryoneaceae bacterium]|nr:permease-like cell division protein FtsX [Candidatus Electryoneaceae bacterium]
MIIWFALKEGWRNFRHLGILGLLTLISLTVTLTLTGGSVRGYLLIEEWTQGLLGRFEIEAFLSPQTDSLAAMELMDVVSSIEQVKSVRYVSPDEAAERFTRQFGGEMFELLEYNPLPSSFVVTLKQESDAATSWAQTALLMEHLEGVDDVVYQGELLSQVDHFYSRGGLGVIIVLGTTLLLSMAFTAMTVYSAIRSREDFIHIVLICGGSWTMARGPFVALGVYYGIASGLFASVMLKVAVEVIRLGWEITVPIPLWWSAGLMVVGILIGIIGASWAAGRRIKEVY